MSHGFVLKLGLENFCGWRCSTSGQPAPMLDGEIFLILFSLNLPHFNFHLSPLFHALLRSSWSSLLDASLEAGQGCCWIPASLLFPGLNKPLSWILIPGHSPPHLFHCPPAELTGADPAGFLPHPMCPLPSSSFPETSPGSSPGL